MHNHPLQLAFIGPGGPEFLLVMLVLLMLFGAKDAPRILRKLNEIINQLRSTAEGFKREVMYSDLNSDGPTYVDEDLGEDFGLDEDDGSGEVVPQEPASEPKNSSDEEGDAEKA